jgi:AraC-like DNA-binding protein
MFQCRYAGEARGPRYEQWREEYTRRWLAADFQPLEGDHLVNEFRATEHSFLGVSTMCGTPARTTRREDAQGAARDLMYFLVASDACLETFQRGRTNALTRGQMTLMSNREAAWVRQAQGSRWSIRIPRRLLKDICRNVDDKLAQPITASTELTGLLLHQMTTAHRFGPTLGPSENHVMAQHILDLVGLCLGVDRDAAWAAEQRGLAASRFEAIKADIMSGIGKCELGLPHVASRHGVSVRYVQHLFERAGTSFTHFVLEQRLRLAHRMLLDPNNRWRKVSDIASVTGFPDVSYFNRAFKARFGAPPGELRAGALDERRGGALDS